MNKRIRRKAKVIILMIVLVASIIGLMYDRNENKEIYVSERIKDKSNSGLALMLEETVGKYTESKDRTWPGEGYTFNERLSKCENGSEITYNADLKTVEVAANQAERCYVYFDKEFTLAERCVDQELANCLVENYIQDETIIYHGKVGALRGTEKVENSDLGAEDESYRYTGASNVVNNYVCLGSTVATCPENNLYRIIGMFKNEEGKYELKLIKNLPISGYYWSGSSENRSNDWTKSTLNTENLNSSTSDYWKSLGNDASKIVNHDWVISGGPYEEIYGYSKDTNAKITYNYEVAKICENCPNKVKLKIYSAKVGLMYVSDYAYAADPSFWSTSVSIYSDASYNPNNDWIFMIKGGGDYLFTISPVTDVGYEEHAYAMQSIYGNLFEVSVVYNKPVLFAPTIYLNSTVKLSSGTGTSSDPYRIK